MTQILIVALNSRYTHTSIASKYLFANLGKLQQKAKIQEFSINDEYNTIAEQIISNTPKIVGFGVYIWNALHIQKITQVITSTSPQIQIILGGPEVSYLPFRVDFGNAHYIIQGEAEIAFAQLCSDILSNNAPKTRIIKAPPPNLKELQLPYKYYNEHDIKHRYIYAEASRGCPFECQFCLSAIDPKVRAFDMDILLLEFQKLWQRGARRFKFIDRTFNLNINQAIKLLDFFLSKPPPYMLHLEVIPDNFPQKLKHKLEQFPSNTLQLEIGIQTLNNTILENINRKMNIDKLFKNLEFLQSKTTAHLHLDLIIALPGESIQSFASNLDRLKAATNSEIQIGVLKKLSGTKLHIHDTKYDMIYNQNPPYEILQNNQISFLQMQELKRFARFWDLYYNSGNFYHTISLVFQDGAFEGFYNFSQWIYGQTNSTWHISLNRLSELLFTYLTQIKHFDKTKISDLLMQDIIKIKGRSIPAHISKYASKIPDLRKISIQKHNKRQILRS